MKILLAHKLEQPHSGPALALNRRILVVEDEKRIARNICEALEEAGYTTAAVHDGEEAWFRAETEAFDAIVLVARFN